MSGNPGADPEELGRCHYEEVSDPPPCEEKRKADYKKALRIREAGRQWKKITKSPVQVVGTNPNGKSRSSANEMVEALLLVPSFDNSPVA